MKKRKVPIRTCVISKQTYPKNELTRIVCNKVGIVQIDLTGKAHGRGAYIKLSKENIALARKKALLDRSLKTTVDESVYEELERLCDEESIK